MPISATAIRTASPSWTCAIRRTRGPSPSRPARPTPAPSISRPTTTCCLPSTGRACGRCRSMLRPTTRDRLKGRQYTAGIRIFDIAHPEAPREIAFMAAEGVGPHRIWYVGGRYAYVSIHYPEFTDQVLAIVDMAEPTRPEVVGKWWIPGMWTGGGGTPSWPKGRGYALHHALVAGNLAYAAWRDGGLTVLDVGDRTRPKLLAHRNLDPPFGGGTHSPLPLPDRNLLVLADEANFANCSQGLRHTWLFDVREPTNPVSFATMPVPSEADYCAKGGNFGPHNLWENRPGAFQSSRFVFATYHNAGVRVFDIENPFQPREAGVLRAA